MSSKIYNLDLKIEVPKTYALADSELRKKLVGKRPIKQLYQTLQDLDGELYETLEEEINSQLPEEQKEMLEDMEEKESEKEKMEEHHEAMLEKLDTVVEAVRTIGTPEINFPDPVEVVEVSNLKDIKFPQIPKFPKLPEFDDTRIVAGLDAVRTVIGSIPAPEPYPTTIKIDKPDWYSPTDLDPTNKLLGGLGEAIGNLDISLHDPSKPVKVQILNKKGEIISDFTPKVSVSGGSGGGGGYTGIRDGLKFTRDSDYDFPVGGIYETTPTTLLDGEHGIIGLTSTGAVRTVVESLTGTVTIAEPVTVDATDLDIRNLVFATDKVDVSGSSVTVTATNLDIRDLTHVSDSVQIGDGSNTATIRNLASNDALNVAIVDGSGNQITSFGGGVEYTEGDTDASITGKAMMMEVAADTLQPVQGTVAGGLLVNLGLNNDVTVTGTVDLGATDNAVLDAIAASVAAIDTDATTIIGHVDGIEALLTTIDADTGNIDTSLNNIEADADDIRIAVQLIDDTVFTDDTSTHTTASTKGIGIMAVADPTDASITANDIGMPAMTTTRFLKVVPQANSGVDIGDVDVTSIVPGTGATNLGKREDDAHTSLDTGVMALGVRRDAHTALGNADNDYHPPLLNSLGMTKVQIHGGDALPTFGRTTDTVANTAKQIENTATVVRSITIKALSSNVEPVYIGGLGVATTTGYELLPGEEKEFLANSAVSAWYYIKATAISGGVSYYYDD